MLKGKFRLHRTITMFLTLVFSLGANAQVDSLLHVGESYHRTYRFDDAMDAFEEALEMAADSVQESFINERLLLSQNGSNMSRYVRKPNVVGRKKLSIDDFYLYYPVENRGWRPLPNVLDKDDSCATVKALYAPAWNDVHYFSADDGNGVRSIFMTELQDTLWSVPVKVEELSSPMSNEIYPMLSPDGNTLYFASDGFYGLGGYDIYRSQWNESAGKWSMPENMGFPFSSPEDDFLYVDSEDERYSLFASRRDCPKDSVWVYAIEYERMPVHSPVDDPEQLLELSRMKLLADEASYQKPDVVSDDMALYTRQMTNVRVLKDSIDYISSELEQFRQQLAFSNDDVERFEISAKIIEQERKIPVLQAELEKASIEFQKTETEFLKRGVFSRPVHNEPARESRPVYEFVKLAPGDSLRMNIAVPEEKFDYSFRVLDEALFAEDQSLPSGIVYQIQLLGGSHAVDATALKGLSPIYEHRSPSGMYIYRVGRFSSYSEALECVYVVRDLGFKSAYLCAFDNGKEISVAKARTLQEQLRSGFSLCEIRIIPDSGELDPGVVDFIISKAVGKDIMRKESSDGTQIFIVAPFDDMIVAEELATAVRGMVQGRVECEPITD